LDLAGALDRRFPVDELALFQRRFDDARGRDPRVFAAEPLQRIALAAKQAVHYFEMETAQGIIEPAVTIETLENHSPDDERTEQERHHRVPAVHDPLENRHIWRGRSVHVRLARYASSA